MTKKAPEIVVIAHNLRSIHNVGAILRTCDGLGIKRFIATGTTPYPNASDTQLPHVVTRLNRQIAKTALGAEKYIEIKHGEIEDVLKEFSKKGYQICALEQSEDSIDLADFRSKDSLVLVVGNETDGIEKEVLDRCDAILEIPMQGKKESLNVASAAAIAIWHLAN